jgi:type VI secretion system protein ImpC
MTELGPTCTISIPTDLHPDGSLEIHFKKLKDFHPDTLIQTNPLLRNLLEAKTYIQEAFAKRLPAQEMNARLKQWPNLPPIQIQTETHGSRSMSHRSLDKIFNMVAMPDEVPGAPVGPQSTESQINTMIKEVLRHIFQDEGFRTLEASWRGLRLFLQHVNAYNHALVEVVPVSMDSLDETLDTITVELIQDPPSLIIVDLPMDNTPRSLESLETIARFSETLLVPAITWISPTFLNIDQWQDIHKLSFLPHYLEEPPFAKWQTFKKTPSARWLALTCNRIMARYPYGRDNQPKLVPFEESNPLWISPVWALGSLIGLSLAKTGWPTQFAYWQEIRLEDLPLNTAAPHNPLPTEINFNRDRIDQFIRSGITPFATIPGKDMAFTPAETTVGGPSLSYQLFLSRITQLVLWCKDHIEKGLQGVELEARLRQAFSSFWESTGHPGPDSLEILIDPPNPDSRIPVRITLEPSRRILPSREKVEMAFYW